MIVKRQKRAAAAAKAAPGAGISKLCAKLTILVSKTIRLQPDTDIRRDDMFVLNGDTYIVTDVTPTAGRNSGEDEACHDINWVGDRGGDARAYGLIRARKVPVLRQIVDHWAGVSKPTRQNNARGTTRRATPPVAARVRRKEAVMSVIIYPSHGVDYGLWLEIRFAGAYPSFGRRLRAYPTDSDVIRGVFQLMAATLRALPKPCFLAMLP